MGKLEPLCGAGGNVIWYSHFKTFKTVWQFSKWLNIELPTDPAIPLLGIYPGEIKSLQPHKNLYRYVHSSIIPNVHQQMIRERKCGMSVQWHTNRQEKGMKNWYMPNTKSQEEGREYRTHIWRNRDPKHPKSARRHIFTDSRSSVNAKEGKLKTNSFPETS